MNKSGRSRLSDDGEDRKPRIPGGSAFAFILAKLGRRDHTEKELKAALTRKGYEEESAEAALLRARNEGLVNDERLAQTMARLAARTGKRGPLRVLATLKMKGIDRETAQAVTRQAFSGSDEAEQSLIRFATRLLQRARGDTTKQKRDRVQRSLLMRGFELSQARDALRLAENSRMTENRTHDASE